MAIGSALRELKIKSPLDLWRVSRGLVLTIWDPTRADIQHGINRFIHRGIQEASPAQIEALEAASPELVALFREGYDPDISPERLEALPDGTLGREYARFIRDNGIDPLAVLVELGEPKSTLEYLFRRAYKLHDLMHIVLDCDATVLGEVPIVSFSLGQAGARQSEGPRAPAMALAVLIMNIGLRRPHEMPHAVRLAARWLEIGERARWHVTFRVEDYLDKPVAEIRTVMLPDLEPA